MCTISPLVRGEKSKLYEELYSFTKKDRRLTNFLYALSLQPSIQEQFSKKERNSLGEPLIDDFVRKFKLKDFIAQSEDIQTERVNIGAVDSSGEPIQYDTPDEVYDRVKEYNEGNTRYKATISYDNGKFIIKLDRINAGNFRNNEVLETRMAQFQGINKYLAELGFSTDYSISTRASIANFLNSKFFRNALFDLKSSVEDLSLAKAGLLLDLMKDRSPFVQRIIDNFGDDAAEIVSIVSSEKEDSRIDGYWSSIISRFLEQSQEALRSLTLQNLEAAQKEFTDSIPPSEAKWFGVDSEILNNTLRDLYDKYHLNQDLLTSSNDALSSLSSVAEKLFNLGLTRLDIARHQENPNVREMSKNLNIRQRNIENGKYAESIISFLKELLDEFVAADDRFAGIKTELEERTGDEDVDLQRLNEISKFIFDNLKLIGAYQPIIDTLTAADALTLDQPDLPREFISSLQETARTINNLMAEIRGRARDAQFEAVVGLLSISTWGNEDVKKLSSGEERSLRDIVHNLSVDPNMFDRLIYSLNESNDTGIALIHNTIKTRYRERDERLREIEYIVRRITDDLYKSDSDSTFMFKRNEKGIPTGKLISNIDFSAYERDKKEFIASLKREGIRGKEFNKRMWEWIKIHKSNQYVPFDGKNSVYNKAFEEYCRAIYGKVPTIIDDKGREVPADFVVEVPNPDIYKTNDLDNLTAAQYEYYSKMLALKAALGLYIPEDLDLFDAVQISGDILNALKETGGNPSRLLDLAKNKFKDAFQKREDDADFGETFSDVLEANGMKQAVMDLNGHEFMSMPLFFTHKLKDLTRLSTDFSRSILAYGQTAMQYYELNKISDALLLTEDYFQTQRKPLAEQGGTGVVNLVRTGGNTFARMLTKTDTTSSSMLTDLYERELYGRKKKQGKTLSLFGLNVSSDKAIDWLVGYTSRTGLAVNILGAQANTLVGKIQMFIEANAGEFFDLGDAAIAELKYFQHLPAYLNEFMSDNKTSFLGLLGDRFDIMEGFYSELRSKGFEKSIIGKILSNTNLFALYGMGEHLLHFEGALSVLHNYKVYDTQTKGEITLLEAMEKSHEENLQAHKDDRNLKFYFNTGRYQFIEYKDKSKYSRRKKEQRKEDIEKVYRPFTKKDMERVEKDITYVNKSLHGAFNDFEKGLASRYAAGRLVMNFRQWMPAHYQRRFRGRHYDADLGDDREGYYTSSWKFLVDCCKDLKRARVQIGTRWNELSDMEKYNLKRTLAELETLVLLSVTNLSLGEYKDKKGNWAYRNLMYQVKRMLMEVKASTPVPDFLPLFVGKPAQPLAFVDNLMQILNSPAAALNTVDNILTLMDLSKLFLTVEGGKHKGENLYFHNLERVAPYYGSLRKQIDMANEDYIFQVFE